MQYEISNDVEKVAKEVIKEHHKDELSHRRIVYITQEKKESDFNPTGTGKANPLDQAGRYIHIIHQYNPGNARQAAQYFADLVEELDRTVGDSERPGARVR